MKVNLLVLPDEYTTWNVRLVLPGQKYGLDWCLTCDDKPLVEFYDSRYDHTVFGQFVGRYSADNLMERGDGGLMLNAEIEAWRVSPENMSRIIDDWLWGLKIDKLI